MTGCAANLQGGDVHYTDECYCAGVAYVGADDPDTSGAICTRTDEGQYYCWAPPGRCADSTPGSAFGVAFPDGIDYEATLIPCEEEEQAEAAASSTHMRGVTYTHKFYTQPSSQLTTPSLQKTKNIGANF